MSEQQGDGGQIQEEIGKHLEELLNEIKREGKVDQEEEGRLEDVMDLQQDLHDILSEIKNITIERDEQLELVSNKLERFKEQIKEGPTNHPSPEKWAEKQKQELNELKEHLREIEETQSEVETLKQRAHDELERIFNDMDAVSSAEDKASKLTTEAEAHLAKIEEEEDAFIEYIDSHVQRNKDLEQ